MTAPTTTPAAQAYLSEVEAELADLPADERAELLDDLSSHLLALEEEGDARSLTARLGSSAEYAAELRAAAGLPPRGKSGPRRIEWRARVDHLRQHRAVREVLDFAPQLRPAWWVLRGYLVVLLPSLRAINGTRDFPLPAVGGSHLLGLLTVLAAIAASVALGRRRLPRPLTVAVVLVNLVLVVSAARVLDQARYRLTVYPAYGASAAPGRTFADSPLVAQNGGPVTNILPYAADGTPLDGVLLFDQDGRPLQVGAQQWWADGCVRIVTPPRAKDGAPVTFSFPQTYALDPLGRRLDGNSTPPGGCAATLPRPAVPLPVFPAAPKKPAAPVKH
jgi:hypothetical protein